MGKTNDEILELIQKNASANEISKITGLSNKQLFHRLNMLKIKGYDFSRKYYSDGEIVYHLNKGFEKEKDICLITKPKDNELKLVLISDLHTSNEKERIDLLNEVYEFCVKNDINIIINAGDVIDGLLGSQAKKYNTIEEQIEYLIKTHPFDKNILNFVCLGNHDYDALEKTGQNLETSLFNRRHDIISIGYGTGIINIKNDKLVVRHPNTPITPKYKNIDLNENTFIISGHSHHAKQIYCGNLLNYKLPSLSDLKTDNYSFPGFVKATINFNLGIFDNVLIEQYIFLDKMYKVNESFNQLYGSKKTDVNAIKYEENRIPYKEEEIIEQPIVRTRKGTSQIDKFNKRYNG